MHIPQNHEPKNNLLETTTQNKKKTKKLRKQKKTKNNETIEKQKIKGKGQVGRPPKKYTTRNK